MVHIYYASIKKKLCFISSIYLRNYALIFMFILVGTFSDIPRNNIKRKLESENYLIFKIGETENKVDITNEITNWPQFYQGINLVKGSITSIIVNIQDSSLVKNMNSMFYQFSNLQSIHFSKINTSEVTDMDNFLYDNQKLESITGLENFDTSKVTRMSYAFDKCPLLTSIDLSKFDTSNVKSFLCMFRGDYNLKSLDLYNFNTSKVTDMSFMFQGCFSLTSIDVSKFDTSNVQDMQRMFQGCPFTSIDVSNFDTSKVTNMGQMFCECSYLNSLNILNFDTSKVTNMEYMFSDCVSLKYINISNFNTELVTNMNKMFYNCASLKVLDISKFNMIKVTSYNDMFSNDKIDNIRYLIIDNLQNNNVIDTMFNNVDNLDVCTKEPEFTNQNIRYICCDYDYDNDICELKTPTNTLTEIKAEISELPTIKDNNCEIEEIINNVCREKPITFSEMQEIKKRLLNEDYNGENLFIETKNVIVQLSKLEDQVNQNNVNISNIDLGECEDILRKANNIENEDEDLIIYKTDIKTSDSSSTYVTYEVYDSHLNKLNIDVCNNAQITINVPVRLDDNFVNLIQRLKEQGYNIFDENDPFYNDICSTYTSENKVDILLSDRKKDIYTMTLNKSLCQSGCEINSYNSITKQIKCDCDITTYSSKTNSLNIDNLFNKKEIAKSFYDTLANSNFRVMKCYKYAIYFIQFWNNYGGIIMIILIILFLIMMIIYFILGNKQINNFLSIILKWNYQGKAGNNAINNSKTKKK